MADHTPFQGGISRRPSSYVNTHMWHPHWEPPVCSYWPHHTKFIHHILFGIQALTEVGCEVAFDKHKCIVWYNGKIILSRGKDPAMDPWTLPLGSTGTSSHHKDVVIPPTAPVVANARANLTTQIAFFTHTLQNKENSICFAHQSLCNPHILTLLKAIWRGYLKGCPNLTAKGVTKYLNPSPATAKGHMKQPHQGIRSTRQGSSVTTVIYTPSYHQSTSTPSTMMTPMTSSNLHPPIAPIIVTPISSRTMIRQALPTCFAFLPHLQTSKMGHFTMTSLVHSHYVLQGNVCFLVVYHYKSNAVMALPIASFGNIIIFMACKQNELLESKGYCIKLNVMGNQTSCIIIQHLTPKQCDWMLVEPNNHCVNATKRAIQMFKNHFISALATTGSKFPLQLWDHLAPQVKNTLNMHCPLHIDPKMLSYKNHPQPLQLEQVSTCAAGM